MEYPPRPIVKEPHFDPIKTIPIIRTDNDGIGAIKKRRIEIERRLDVDQLGEYMFVECETLGSLQEGYCRRYLRLVGQWEKALHRIAVIMRAKALIDRPYGFGKPVHAVCALCDRQIGDQQGEEEWKEAVHFPASFFSDQVPLMYKFVPA